MKKLIIVRSGSTYWEEQEHNVPAGGMISQLEDDKRLQGTLPLPLDDSDKAILRGIALIISREDISLIYNSGNESSGAAAEYLGELCGVKTKKIPLLREMDCGLWQGLKIGEIKQRFGSAYRQWRTDPISVCPPEGETMAETCERVEEGLLKINRKNTNKTVVIVAAPLVSALIECIITDADRCKLLANNTHHSDSNDSYPDLVHLWNFVDRPERLQIYKRNGDKFFRETHDDSKVCTNSARGQ